MADKKLGFSEETVVSPNFTVRTWIIVAGAILTFFASLGSILYKGSDWASDVKADVASVRDDVAGLKSNSDARIRALEEFDRARTVELNARHGLIDLQIKALENRQAQIDNAITRIDTNIEWIRKNQELDGKK